MRAMKCPSGVGDYVNEQKRKTDYTFLPCCAPVVRLCHGHHRGHSSIAPSPCRHIPLMNAVLRDSIAADLTVVPRETDHNSQNPANAWVGQLGHSIGHRQNIFFQQILLAPLWCEKLHQKFAYLNHQLKFLKWKKLDRDGNRKLY